MNTNTPQTQDTPETITKAAIIVNDTVWTGWRHCFIIGEYCKKTGKKRCPATNHPNENKSNQGFITNTGRYVDRKEALAIAQSANQYIIKHGCSTELYSEDLWDVNGIPYPPQSPPPNP